LKKFQFGFLLLLTVSVVNCAKKGFPPGGPADITRPTVVNSLPADKATKIPLTASIQILFSEKMNHKSVEGAINLMPSVDYKLEWSDNSLTLKPKTALANNQTYVVSLGTECQDLQGNRLTNPFTFAFSTGETIDSGSVAGVTIQEGRLEPGAAVWAYKLNKNSESVLPWQRKADYATSSNREGKFKLNYLAAGQYRLLAVKDLNKNQLWDPATELLGLTYKEVSLDRNESQIEGLPLVLVSRDTTSLALLNCQMLDRNSIKLTLSKELGRVKSGSAEIKIIGEEGDTLKSITVYQVHKQPKYLYLRVSGALPSKTYRIMVSNLYSADGSLLGAKSDTCKFTAVESPDQVRPEVVDHFPEEKGKDVASDAELSLYFSEPMEDKIEAEKFQVEDSAGKKVQGTLSWIDELGLSFVPSKPWLPNTNYSARLAGSAVQDLAGNSLKDTMLTFSFRTIDAEKTGSVTGKVSFSQDKLLGKIFLNLKGLDSNANYQEILSSGDSFSFLNVLPGKYLLNGFIDFDQSGAYSYGTVEPFTTSEPYAVNPDTLVVRSRWTTENVILQF
jgi:hypothetical protein